VQTKWQAIDIAIRECGKELSQNNWFARRAKDQYEVWHTTDGWQDVLVYIDPANGKLLSDCMYSEE